MRWKSILGLCVAFVVFEVVMADEAKTGDAEKHGPIWIEEGEWVHLSEEPGRHLDHAHDAFVAVDAREAAAELRKAAAFMRVSARDAGDRVQTTLNSSVKELEALARRMEKGTVKAAADVDVATARAHHALAEYHNAKARQAWTAGEHHRAGRFWRSAATSLERATARTDAAFRKTTEGIVRESRLMSAKLVEGTETVTDEIGRGMESFGKQVELAGKRIERQRQ